MKVKIIYTGRRKVNEVIVHRFVFSNDIKKEIFFKSITGTVIGWAYEVTKTKKGFQIERYPKQVELKEPPTDKQIEEWEIEDLIVQEYINTKRAIKKARSNKKIINKLRPVLDDHVKNMNYYEIDSFINFVVKSLWLKK